MNMLLLTNAPTWVFLTEAEAEKAATDLGKGEAEGWTYTVVPDPIGSGRCIIKVYDENGEFISNLTR
ncbi:MAG: hypothetical protein WC326_13005 [Candidatus Delongbacteria bacterium]